MELIFGIGTAFWVGILTSISPCPLATNIAAISYISKNVKSTKSVLLTGSLYTLGRIFAYVALSLLIIKGVYSIPGLSLFLQTQIHKILGPLLVLVGMFLLELIPFYIPTITGSTKIQNYLKDTGMWGAFPLGIIFALSFCPVSAALYFGSLIPLVSKISSPFILPSMYGIGTGIPVFVFALILALGANKIGKIFNCIKKFEYWLRTITGIVFIGVGIYLTLTYIFEIF